MLTHLDELLVYTSTTYNQRDIYHIWYIIHIVIDLSYVVRYTPDEEPFSDAHSSTFSSICLR